MNNMTQRAITGTLFVAGIVAMVTYGSMSTLILLSLIGFIGLYEYFNIICKGKPGVKHWALILSGGFIIPLVQISGILPVLLILPVIFMLYAILNLFAEDRKWANIGQSLFGLMYISVPLIMLYHSVYVFPDYGGSNLFEGAKALKALNLFVLIWSSDTFAYISGKAFGKHKLFEKISPGKTWEGFAGGALLTMVLSYFLAGFFGINPILNIVIGLLTVVFGTLGDLVESMLKREYGIKDSGKILPGHGGVLDRFDALLVSLPFTTSVYYLAEILKIY